MADATAQGSATALPAGSVRRGLPAPLGWALCVALGLALGALCRFPLTWSYLTGWAVAWKAGWASIDPTLVDDGIGVFFVLISGAWLVFALVAGPSTAVARRRARLPARTWWWTSVALWIAPFAVLDLPALLG